MRSRRLALASAGTVVASQDAHTGRRLIAARSTIEASAASGPLVQLTGELVAALDRRAAKRGMSRSALIRELIVAGLGDESGRTVSQLMIDGYERVPQETSSDAWGDLDRWSEVNAQRNLAALGAEEGRRLVARREVWWSEDPVLGRRPVLVLSRDAVLATSARPLVAPLTTRMQIPRLPICGAERR